MKLSTYLGITLSALTLASMAYIRVDAKEQESVVDYTYTEDYTQLSCLALNVYFEARGESNIGQRAVAWVTLNRVESDKYADTICGVVWEDSQFSWTNDGKSDRPRDIMAYVEALYIAYDVISEYHHVDDPTEGAIMYHSSKVKPYWKNKYVRVNQIDNHIFYKEADHG